MEYRQFGKTGFNISEVSLGTWQLGGKWGAEFSEKDALDTLAEAYDRGVNFFDTADGYAITGGVFAGEQPDSTFCGIGNAKTFEGNIDGESIIIGNHTFVKR